MNSRAQDGIMLTKQAVVLLKAIDDVVSRLVGFENVKLALHNIGSFDERELTGFPAGGCVIELSSAIDRVHTCEMKVFVPKDSDPEGRDWFDVILNGDTHIELYQEPRADAKSEFPVLREFEVLCERVITGDLRGEAEMSFMPYPKRTG